jgi:hypothetical protein
MVQQHAKTLGAWAVALLCAMSLSLPGTAWSAEDEEPLSLPPVQKRDLKPLSPTVEAVATPTAVSLPVVASMPAAAVAPLAAAPVAVPLAKAKAALKVLGVSHKASRLGIEVILKANGPVSAKVSRLKNPDRILARVANAILAGPKQTIRLSAGAAKQVRIAQNHGEVWMVVDLSEPVDFSVLAGLKNAWGLSLVTGAAPAAAAPQPTAAPAQPARTASSSTAQLPHVEMMLFDKNVLFQGKQYDRFPCANLIYDKGDAFPLDREFSTNLVFSQGYGAFVGNLRLVGPEGQVIDQTREPFAFNLFNALTDYSVETPWKVRFERSGWYRIILTLNGEDTLEHKFYVGHNDDKP